MDPQADARALVAERFANARAAFLGPGVLSAYRTSTSDLDIVVVLDGPPAPFRESLRWRDWPVELFVHDPASVEEFLARDIARRKPNLARMVADGVTLADGHGIAADLRKRARQVLDAGPPPLSPAELRLRRYGLSDLLDDLAGSTDAGETAVISWHVLVQAAELALLQDGRWLGGGKWLLRELRAAEPDLAQALLAGLGSPAQLTAAAGEVLARSGGRLWEGFRQPGRNAQTR
jgi:hypothetical protein